MAQTILLIEDHVYLRENLGMMLEFEGYRVIEAENGSMGIRRALDESPSLILCDFNLPGLDGFDIFTFLRRDRKTMEIPIVFLIGSVEGNDRFQAIQDRVADYLFKPCSITRVLAAIQRCLS